MASQSLKVDAVRSAEVYRAWGDDSAFPETPQVGMEGSDLVDGASLALLKSEWMAAQAGVVPFIPLPGGGQGVMTIGGALTEPENKWPQPELRHLYLMSHRNMQALHASVIAKRIATPELVVPDITETEAARQFQTVGGEVDQAPIVIPVAYVVYAVVGILATMGAAWYMVRTDEKKIQVDGDKAKEAHRIGVLADLISAQIMKTGKADPNLIKAIGPYKPESSWNPWPYVAVGTGAAVVGGFATYKALTYKRRR